MENFSREEKFMRMAIEEARKGVGKTDPNPAVGAVIVEENQIVAKGYHEKAGLAHAEIMALRSLGRKPQQNSEMYVTLEPCSTMGKTPACTDAIIAAGISKVVIGAIDPNPKHQGKGIEILEAHHVQVLQGVLEKECEQLNLEFNSRMKT